MYTEYALVLHRPLTTRYDFMYSGNSIGREDGRLYHSSALHHSATTTDESANDQ